MVWLRSHGTHPDGAGGALADSHDSGRLGKAKGYARFLTKSGSLNFTQKHRVTSSNPFLNRGFDIFSENESYSLNGKTCGRVKFSDAGGDFR